MNVKKQVTAIVLVEKNDEGHVSTSNLMPVRFVPLTRAKKEE